MQILSEYRNENMETKDRLTLAIREARYNDAAGIIHKLKSSSGSIGAKPVYERAVRLQKALEEGREREIDALSRDFIEKLDRLLDEIRATLESSAKA